jgi:hypothetical protein
MIFFLGRTRIERDVSFEGRWINVVIKRRRIVVEGSDHFESRLRVC